MTTNFSVLISVYFKESPKSLNLALKSIFEQTLLPSEVVLIKDGNLTEKLDNVINKYQKTYSSVLKVIHYEKNQGLGVSLNKGVKLCKFDIILRMDSDDISYPDRFEKQIKYLEKNKHVAVLGGWISEFKENIKEGVRLRKVPEDDKTIKQFLKKRNAFNHMTIAFRKSKVIQAGNYIDMPYFEDYYLWIRMGLQKMKFNNLQSSLVYARTGNDMVGRRHGLKYLVYEFNFYVKIYQLKYISILELLQVLCLRLPLRIIPKKFLIIIYKYLLRGN